MHSSVKRRVSIFCDLFSIWCTLSFAIPRNLKSRLDPRRNGDISISEGNFPCSRGACRGARADITPPAPKIVHTPLVRTYVDLCKGARKCGKLLVKRAGCVNSSGNVEENTELVSVK